MSGAMSDYVTDAMVETAARAEWESYAPTLDGGPWEGLTEAQRASWREGVEVVLAAAIPLVTPAIKAEALREAANELDSNDGEISMPVGLIAVALRARANELEAGSLAAIQANGPGLELPPDSSSLRDRIARAIAGADSGTLHGVRPCAACKTGDTDQPCDDCLIMADAVIEALGLTEEPGHFTPTPTRTTED